MEVKGSWSGRLRKDQPVLLISTRRLAVKGRQGRSAQTKNISDCIPNAASNLPHKRRSLREMRCRLAVAYELPVPPRKRVPLCVVRFTHRGQTPTQMCCPRCANGVTNAGSSLIPALAIASRYENQVLILRIAKTLRHQRHQISYYGAQFRNVHVFEVTERTQSWCSKYH